MPLMEKTQKDSCLREHGREERQSRIQTERKTRPGRFLNLGPSTYRPGVKVHPEHSEAVRSRLIPRQASRRRGYRISTGVLTPSFLLVGNTGFSPSSDGPA